MGTSKQNKIAKGTPVGAPTGAPKTFWDMMWMDKKKKRSGRRSEMMSMGDTQGSYGSDYETQAGLTVGSDRIKTPWLFKSGKGQYKQTMEDTMRSTIPASTSRSHRRPVFEDSDERLLRLAKEDGHFLARPAKGPPKMTHRATLEKEANDNMYGKYRSQAFAMPQRSSHPTQCPPREPFTPGGTMKGPVDYDLTGTEGPGRYTGIVEGGVPPTDRPYTDLHGVKRSTFKLKKVPAPIAQGLGLIH